MTSRRLVILAVLIASAGAVGRTALIRSTQALQERIAAAEQSLLGVQDKTADLMKLASQVQNLRGQVASTHKTIPQESQMADLMRELSTRMTDLRLSDQAVTVQSVVRDQDKLTLPLEVRVKGDSRNVLEFVRQVEAMARLIHVRDLSVSLHQGQGEIVSADVRLNTFFYQTQEPRP